MAGLRTSGCSMSQYARERGVSLASLFYWKKKLESKDGMSVRLTARPVFSEVVIVPREGTRAARIEVVTRGGVAVRLDGAFDAALLREVLRAVESC